MAAAPVGDDQYGEDPSVNLLQEQVAELLGKEAALFVPSGTMANQIALKLLTRPGDDVIVGDEAHVVWHESGASAANSGVQFTVVGRGGVFTAPISPRPTRHPACRLPADRTGFGREHAQSRRRRRFPAGRRDRDLCSRPQAWRCELPRRRPAVQRGRGDRPDARSARGAVRSRVRRAIEGARLPGRQPDRRSHGAGRRRCARDACSAAPCARPASWPPPVSTRSIITAHASRRTTPTRG